MTILRKIFISAIGVLLVMFSCIGVEPVLASPDLQETTYVVQPGDTLWEIARYHGVSYQAIMDANGVTDPAYLRTGQRLTIPGTPASGVTASSDPNASGETHVVQRGENLSAIAYRYGISLSTIGQANGIVNPSHIRIGQRLMIPGGSAPDAAETLPTPAATPEVRTRNHVVKSGETLSAIAANYGTSVAVIISANRLNNPSVITPGQRLQIPEPPASAPIPTTTHADLSMNVSISQQRCQVYSGQELLYDWPCSTGRPGVGTKTGTFHVQSKIRDAWGSRWGFYMPYWLGIYWAGGTENGIHGLPYAPGGAPIWENALGTPVTYGCVLLGTHESKALWDMAYIGMPITIGY
ncbi:MAG: LysM peptidoglycan-binding domain-containing protein [Chloroflexota bacterium]|nr:LysM peptidoglycan-binding domain-containing protein [Chloroflexota bacterium]